MSYLDQRIHENLKHGIKENQISLWYIIFIVLKLRIDNGDLAAMWH